MAARATLVEQLLDLAWSHWAALGVAGAVPAADVPVDLEALLVLTADLAPEDPRLRDEALDWCNRFHGFASKPRLKQLLCSGSVLGADIIGAVLSRRSEDFGAADLVFIGYSKRNLAEALDMLAAAGLFRSTRTGNRVRFSWQRREQLSALLAPLPDVIPVWSSTLRVMSGFLDLLTRM
jgi:hypothetical protein